MTEGAPPPGARLASRAYLVGVLTVVAAYVVRVRLLGLTFPTPWPDEGSFLWQALAFRDHGTLFAPELNPEREVLWMPPGFMVLEGLVFRIIPFTLERSRLLSTLFLAGAFSLVAIAARGFKSRLGIPLLLAVFLHACPIVLMVGNVARMEALLLVLVTAGFLALGAGRSLGFGLLLFAPLIHPNGGFALVGGALYWFFRRKRTSFEGADRVVIVLGVAAGLAYAAYAGSHWQSFVADIGAQLRFKHFVSTESGGLLSRVGEPAVLVPFAALALAAWGARRFAVPGVSALLALGATLYAQTSVAAGWCYEVYPAFAAFLSFVAFLEVGVHAFARRSLSRAPRTALSVAAPVLLTVLSFLVVARSPFINRSLERAVVERPGRDPEYLTTHDRLLVEGFLRALRPAQGTLVVMFVPDADALEFESLRGPSLRFAQQTFYESRPHMVIAHTSVWFPSWIRDLMLIKMYFMLGKHPREIVLGERDGTERIVVYDWRGVAPP